MNVFQELFRSIYDFKSYKEFLNNKKFKVFLAGLILMVIYFTLTMIVPFIHFQATTGGFLHLAEKNIPNFELTAGTLWVEEPFEFEEYDTYVSIDTDPEWLFYDVDEIGSYISDYSQVILVDSEKIIIKDNGQLQGVYFSDFGMDYNKEQLLTFIPYVYGIIIAFMVIAFLFMTGLFFFGVLVVALLGMLVASCMKYQLTFGQLYLLGIYARTLPLMIKGIVSFLPFSIPMFWVLNFGLSVLYIVFAIHKMKEQALAAPLEFTTDSDNLL